MLIWYLSYQHTNVSVVCSSVPCKYFTVAAGPSILPKLSLSDYANTTLRLWLSSVSGLHQREQSPSANKGLRRFTESDEHDSVSHQDGGQFGRTPVWDVWVVHSQVSLSPPLLSPPLLSPPLLSSPLLSSPLLFEVEFEFSDAFLFIPSFYPRVFEKMFSQSSEEMTMKRYLMAFPSVCSQFSLCGHPLCPEEVSVQSFADQSVSRHNQCVTV